MGGACWESLGVSGANHKDGNTSFSMTVDFSIRGEGRGRKDANMALKSKGWESYPFYLGSAREGGVEANCLFTGQQCLVRAAE